ncbi:MAG: hypothetical protein V7605_1335 [Acidimicrobiaceae bacterium]
MGIWVVLLESVATADERRGLGVEPGALDDLADELAANYAVVTERPWGYETELWVEEGTAGGAMLAAQFLCQTAVRYLGLPPWEVVRAEARDAHALEVGLIEWPTPAVDPDDEPADEPPPLELPATATKAATKKAGTRKRATTKAVTKAVTKTATKKAATRRPAAKKAGSATSRPAKSGLGKPRAAKGRNSRPISRGDA